MIRIVATTTGDYLKNIRLVPIAYENDFTTVFHPQFLNRLRGFDIIIFNGWLCALVLTIYSIVTLCLSAGF